MKRNLLVILILVLFPSTLFGQTLIEEWTAIFDGQAGNKDTVVGFEMDGASNVYVLGYSSVVTSETIRPISFNIIKYDSNGNQLWLTTYAGTDEIAIQQPYAIKIDRSGNVFVVGTSDGDYIILKYDTDGQLLWSSKYDHGGFDAATALTLDGLGHIYITGFSWGEDGNYDFATIKFDSDGNEIWVSRYNFNPGSHDPLGDDKAVGIVVDTGGNVYVTGSSKGDGVNPDWQPPDLSDITTVKYDSDGVQLWVNRYQKIYGEFIPLESSYPVALAIDSDSNVYVSGIIDSYLGSPCRTLKYDTNGNQIYEITTSEPYNAAVCKAVSIDAFGNLYSVHYIANIPDPSLWGLEKYGPSGEVLWWRRINKPDYPTLYVSSSGDSYVGSPTNWIESYNASLSFHHYDTDGNILESFSNQFAFKFYNGLIGVLVDTSGNVVVAGDIRGVDSEEHFATMMLTPASTDPDNGGGNDGGGNSGSDSSGGVSSGGGGGGGCFLSAAQ